MKAMKTYFYSALALTLFLAMGLDGFGQGNKVEKTFQWKYKVDESVKFTFNNYNCDLIIHTWDKPEVEYKMAVDATLNSAEEARELEDFINKLEFSHSTGSLEFDNRFWTSKKTVMGRSTITLKGGGKLRFKEFKTKGEMWIPEACILDLQSKYSEINLDDINGRLSLDLYNDKLYGGTVNSSLKIAAKYSTLEFKNVKDIDADLYNTNIETGDAGDLDIVSKYSDFRSGNVGKVTIDAYNDKYSFENTGDIKFTDKYSDLNAKISGHIRLDCYNSTVNLVSAQDVELTSKYGKYAIEGARNLNIATSYNDNYKMGSLHSLNISESKYGIYKVNHLESSLLLKDGYSDKFFVTKTGNFKEVKIVGKYIVVEMALDKDLSYRFKANVKYPKFEINEEAMNIRVKIKEGSDLQMEAIKGQEREGMPAFFVNGYEMAITLIDNL
ncbi:MAG: hypothetical protein E4H10_15040 [Bacteroidia bacterium]|nr:MAG: hypothetical protein E4H10_15040 [Bacteroidia bacterium]